MGETREREGETNAQMEYADQQKKGKYASMRFFDRKRIDSSTRYARRCKSMRNKSAYKEKQRKKEPNKNKERKTTRERNTKRKEKEKRSHKRRAQTGETNKNTRRRVFLTENLCQRVSTMCKEMRVYAQKPCL